MSTPAAKLSVMVGEKCACIKITGRANFTSSIDFKTLVNGLMHKGYNCFVLELSDCALMDSTFLGVLAGFGLKMIDNGAGSSGGGIELLNPNPRIIDLLENLGILHLFRVGRGALPGDTELAAAVCATPTREEVTRACLEAHETLMEINPQNVSRFKDVAQFLADDLKRLKSKA